jgi:hypothetical protein
MSRKGSVALIVASSGDVIMATPWTVVVYQPFQWDFCKKQTVVLLGMAVDEAWAVPVHMREVGLRLRTPRVRRRELPQSGSRFGSGGVTCSSWPTGERRRHARSFKLASRLLHSLTRLISHHPHTHHLRPRQYTARFLDTHLPPLRRHNQRITLDIANTQITRQAQSWPNACSKVAAPAALGSRSSSSYCWVSRNSAPISHGITY